MAVYLRCGSLASFLPSFLPSSLPSFLASLLPCFLACFLASLLACACARQIFQLEVNQNSDAGAGLVYARLNPPGWPLRRDGTTAAAATGAGAGDVPLQRVNVTGAVHSIGALSPTAV